MRSRDAAIVLLSYLLASCATSALDMAPERPDRPWTPATTADGVSKLCFRCLMRTAIRFDDEFACETHEIRAIRPDRRLPAKAIAIDR